MNSTHPIASWGKSLSFYLSPVYCSHLSHSLLPPPSSLFGGGHPAALSAQGRERGIFPLGRPRKGRPFVVFRVPNFLFPLPPPSPIWTSFPSDPPRFPGRCQEIGWKREDEMGASLPPAPPPKVEEVASPSDRGNFSLFCLCPCAESQCFTFEENFSSL